MSGERYGDFDSLAFEGCMCLEDRNGLLVKEIGMYVQEESLGLELIIDSILISPPQSIRILCHPNKLQHAQDATKTSDLWQTGFQAELLVIRRDFKAALK